MHLTQVLLPLYGNDGQRFAAELFDEVRRELAQRFGGLTVYSQAPVKGLWQQEAQEPMVSDELIIFEVMSERCGKSWWRSYRIRLQRSFQQERIIVRSHKIRLL